MLGSYIKKAGYTTLIFSFSSIFSRFFSFLFLPYFLSKLTLEEFGLWEYYQSFFSIGSLIITSAAASGLTRYYLLYKDNYEKQYKTIGNTFLMVTITAIIVPFLGLLSIYTCIPSLQKSPYLTITFATLSFFSCFSIVLVYLRVKEYLIHYLVVFCLQNFIALFLTVIGITNNFGIKIFFHANLISYFIFIPCFIYILIRHFTFCPILFKEQMQYTIPLLIYSFIYVLFFNLDRWIIRYYSGYELLGQYALLWRFGTIFQFFAIAMFDAWPLILFNAQKEKNSTLLITRLIKLYTAILASGCLFSIVISRSAIDLFFPEKYYYLGTYLPLFFFSLIFMEITKIFQSGLGLATKTTILPLLTLITTGAQLLLLKIFYRFHLWGIFTANILTFCLFSYISYCASIKAYPHHIFDIKKLCSIFFLLGCNIALLQFLFLMPYSFFEGTMLCCFWPILVWKCVLNDGERKLLITKLTSLIDNYFKQKQSVPIYHLKTILFLKTDVYTQEIAGGGSHSQTIGELNAFKKNGYSILCAASTMKETLKKCNPDYFQSLSVWPAFFFLRWKIGFLRWHADCLISNLCFSLQTKHLFKKYSIDAIYQCYSWMNFTGLILSRLKNKPLILEFNGSEVWISNYVKEEKSIIHKIAEYIEYLNLTYADFIVVISAALKEKLIEQGFNEKKILVNPNGADIDLFNPATKTDREQAILKEKLNIPTDAYLFGYISTFSFWHGIELLTDLIPQVIKKYQKVHFLLIGDGMLKTNMEAHLLKLNLESYVTFTGMVDLTTARNYLALCDAFLCPTQPHKDGSRSFYSPIKLFEYMSLAKPILASDLEQQQEILNPALRLNDLNNNNITNECGILLDPQNIQAWYDAVALLLTFSKKNNLALGNNARNKILSHYTWDHHIEKIKKFVEF